MLPCQQTEKISWSCKIRNTEKLEIYYKKRIKIKVTKEHTIAKIKIENVKIKSNSNVNK